VQYERADSPGGLLGGVDSAKQQPTSGRARRRATVYLLEEAPLAVEGSAGDETSYRVACRLKDMGVVEADCLALLIEHWNDRCSPPWSIDDLKTKVANAYRYGREPLGAAAPEVQFEPIQPTIDPEPAVSDLHPFDLMNRNHAFVIAGDGHFILHEEETDDAQTRMRHWDLTTFHLRHASWSMMLGDGKSSQVSKLWLTSPERRSYYRVCFRPGREVAPDTLNMWRGFAVEPLAKGETPDLEWQMALDAFLAHARENVCNGNERLFNQLIGWFAHLVQRPWDKPLVALVFRGGKGVGKNALVERVGALLGQHFLLASNRRYLVGNFNGHLENCLLFALDEAFWSGDKQAEGTLKDLITGKWHLVEHKNEKPYLIENCARIVIIGNEDWLVPASHDERRFLVFDVGDGRKQDRRFFQAMREGMERGGYRLLLRFLLDYDLSTVDVNEAIATDALLDQKTASLHPFHSWWLDSLTEGSLVNSDFAGWPTEIEKDRLRDAFKRYHKARNIRAQVTDDRAIGKLLKRALPSIDASGKRHIPSSEGGGQINLYRIPPLEACAEWDAFIGHPGAWD